MFSHLELSNAWNDLKKKQFKKRKWPIGEFLSFSHLELNKSWFALKKAVREKKKSNRTTNFRIFSHSGHEKVSIFLSKQYLSAYFLKFLTSKYGFCKKSHRKNVTLNSRKLFSSQKGSDFGKKVAKIEYEKGQISNWKNNARLFSRFLKFLKLHNSILANKWQKWGLKSVIEKKKIDFQFTLVTYAPCDFL